MSLILSSDVGRPLTPTELDSNALYLQGVAQSQSTVAQSSASQAVAASTTASSAAATAATNATNTSISNATAALAASQVAAANSASAAAASATTAQNQASNAAASATSAATSLANLDPANMSAPSSFDGTEIWAGKKTGSWSKFTLSSVGNWITSSYGVFRQSGIGAISRAIISKLFDQYVTPQDFGAKGDGVTDDTVAINNAINFLGLTGGGCLFFPGATYLVSNYNTSSSSWDTNVCIWVLYSNITLLGEGVGVSKIKMANNANSHTICWGQRTGGTVTVSNCVFDGIEVDGNRSNQNAAVDANVYHNCGLMVQTGCTNINIRNFYVHDCIWYGIGFQRDGFFNCSVRNGRISNTGVDSIDWKNDSDNSYGNMIDNVVTDNWGLLATATTSDPSASFDLRSGISASNLVARVPGQSAVAGIRLQNGTPGATPVQATKVNGYLVAGANVAGTAGVRVISRNVDVVNGYSTAWDDGHSFTEPDCRYGNLYSYGNVTSGFRFWNNASAGTLASTNSSYGLIARGNGTGIITDGNVAELNFNSCDVRGNTNIGYDIRTGSNLVRIMGGSCTGNGNNVSDNGTSTIMQAVSGYKTKNVVTGTVAIDSTGTKSFSMAHGLGFTPNTADVMLTLRRNTNVGDWSYGFFWVTSCDSVNINGQLRVLTASATTGAIVDVLATVESKNR